MYNFRGHFVALSIEIRLGDSDACAVEVLRV